MQSGGEQVDLLRRTITCPGCQYDLRGLPGDRFNCPECGLAIDVAELAMRRWIGPWWHAPGFQKILGPVVWSVAGVGLLGMVTIVESDGEPGSAAAAFLIALVAVWIIWVIRVAALRTVLPSGEAIVLSLLAHGLFAGYLLSVWGGLGSAVAALANLNSPRFVIWLAAAGAMTGLFWLCRRGERFIAERCIRHYLTGWAADRYHGHDESRAGPRADA